MKTKSWMAAAAVVSSAALVMFLAPKTAHAVVATLVQVANTSANPVLSRNVDKPGWMPYVLTTQIPFSGTSIYSNTYNLQNPTGSLFVAESVTCSAQMPVTDVLANCDFSTFPFAATAQLPQINQQDLRFPTLYSGPNTNSNQVYYTGSSLARMYLPAGQSVNVGAVRTAAGGTPLSSSGEVYVTFTLSGYLLSLQ